MKPQLGSQVGHLAQRSIVKTLRQPAIVVPTLIFPLFFLAITASGLGSATKIKGFPTDSYLTFALGTTFVQAGMSSVVISGSALAEDIQTGFLSRLSLTPIRGSAILLGHLAGTLVLGFIAAGVYLAVGLAFGAELETGPLGAAALLPYSVLVALAFGGIGLLAALRTGSTETVQAVFPILFVLFFLSSMTLPRNLIEADWFKTIATYNPLSYLIEAARSLWVSGWDAEALALGCGIAVVIALASLLGATTQLRLRMLRT